MYTKKEYLRHLLLFIVTFICTTLAGGEWLFGRSVLSSEKPLTWEYFVRSMAFSIPFIGILLVHELGHLFTSLRLKVKASLPIFLPFWLGFMGMPSIGTMGAVIKMKAFVNSRRKFFDIGVAGPLAGFVIALAVLFFGFTHLPEADFIYEIHPEYMDPDYDPDQEEIINIQLGQNLLFYGMENLLADPEKMPNMSEVIHYPYLFAGYLALFFTALNLLPIGQLDGGHIIFGLFPRHHKQISLVFYIAFLFFAGLGVVNPYLEPTYLYIALPIYIGFLYICFKKSGFPRQTKWTIVLAIVSIQYALTYAFPHLQGYEGWLLYAFLLGRVLGLEHPPVQDGTRLDRPRKIVAWVAIIIFIICFTPRPFMIS
ncbi:site-2 protease family protein [Echinicola strongylocentroti]|uniref:Site-2 protease family protein n=1 Tax=Echinicola strongylocentroti TaxID=1795355 RepID=A0A2Z4IN68_9BACT|nr:site-2 protease family protein [Echinicola strongylocentroti]AWW32187.1 site-2 protease family protein [Echinicola strongylocentroti]